MSGNLRHLGHFRDEKLITLFEQAFSEAKIEFEIRNEISSKTHVEAQHIFVAVESEEQVLKAQQIYMELLGIQAPQKPSEADEKWMQVAALPLGPIGRFAIIFSVLLFLGNRMESFKALILKFFMSETNKGFLTEITENLEVWRLITPVFLHFSFFHILFNCMWMKELSKILENSFSSKKFLIYCFIIGVTSNIFQYLVTGPKFGGLSGIVYGLLGILWVKKSVDSKFPFMLPKRDIYLMVGWFFLCLTGLLGPIANTAHGVGLGVGIIIGLYDSRDTTIETSTLLKWSGYSAGVLIITFVSELIMAGLGKTTLFYLQFIS